MNFLKFFSKNDSNVVERSAITGGDAFVAESGVGDTGVSDAGFPGFIGREWRNVLFALAISGLAFWLYGSLLVPVCLPGEPANWLMQIAGEAPVLSPRFSVWRGVTGAFVALFPAAQTVFAGNLASAVFGALCVGLVFLVTHALVYLMIEFEDDGDVVTDSADEAFTERMCGLAGVAAAGVFAFSTIFLIVATQAYFYAFHLFWMLGAGYLLLRYMVTGSRISLFAFCVLWGAGMTQHSWFVLMAPVVFGFLVARQLSILVFEARLAAWMAAAVALGGCWLVAETWLFWGSEGFHLMRYGRYLTLFRLTAEGLVAEISGIADRPGWMLVFGVTALPFVSMLMLGRRSLHREANAGLFWTNVFILAAALINMFNLRASVWRSFGYSNLSALSCVMTAMTFGYCVVFFVVYARHALRADRENTIEAPWFVLRLRLKWLVPAVAVFPVLAAAPVWSSVANWRNYDLRGAEFLNLYVNRILDEVTATRRWIVTDRIFADIIALRARERGIAVETIDVSRRANDEIYATQLSRRLPDDELRASLTLGIEFMLQDWVRSRASAPDELLFTVYHFAWMYGGYASMPRGVVFAGGSDVPESDAVAQIAACMTLLEEAGNALDAVSESDVSMVPRLADVVRSRVSLAANNLAYRLESSGHDAAACATLYRRVSEFAPDNISAFINYYSCVAAEDSATREALQSRLAELKKMTAKMSLLAIVFKYGDIRLPEIRTVVGAQLARAGRDAMAAQLLEQELAANADFETGSPLAQLLYANLAMKRNDTGTARKIYEKLSEEDASRHAALLNLFRAALAEKDRDKAAECLEQLASHGLPPETLFASRATFHMVFDELDAALEYSRRLIAEYPENPAGHVLRCDIYTRQYHAAQTDDEKRAIIETLERVLDNLVFYAGHDDINTLMVKGRIELLTGRLRDARFTHLRAAQLAGYTVNLMEMALKIDLLLDDDAQAREHAKMIVTREPRHAFANYVLARCEYNAGRYDIAKIFLNRAASRGTNADMRALMNDITTAQAKAAEEAVTLSPARAEK